MKIAFLSSLNPYNINNWSGTLYYIFQTLKKRNEVVWIGFETIHMIHEFHWKNYGNQIPFIKERYAPMFGLLLAQKLKDEKYDVIVCRDSSLGAYLKIDTPIIYISDATFKLINKAMLNFENEGFGSLIDELDRRMIQNASQLIFSSQWAKQSAIVHYGSTENKIEVIELGANIDRDNSKNYICSQPKDGCNLLFIGKEWRRKGGDKALQTFKLLKERGFRCTLTIVGSQPPKVMNDPDLFIYPFIDKSTEEGQLLFDLLFKRSHFFLLPTEFDCFGIVFCEASSYGIPSITADVGGVSQVVRDGKNGYLLSGNATATDYANQIQFAYSNPEAYNRLCKTSRQEFEERLNWDVWEKKMHSILSRILN